MSYRNLGRLPLSRKEELKILLLGEPAFLFWVGFLAFLFMLPLLALFTCGSLFFTDAFSNDAPSSTMFNLFLIFGLLAIPCTFIYLFGSTGLYSCMNSLTFKSTCKTSTFFKGLIKNFKTSYKFNIYLSVLIGLLVINIGFLAYDDMNFTFKLILLVINIILLLIALLYRPYIMFEVTTFNNNLLSVFHNARFLFTKKPLLSLLNFVIQLIPFILLIFLPLNLLMIPVALLAVGYLSLTSLISFLSNTYIFEENVDPSKIETIYHVGLEKINS